MIKAFKDKVKSVVWPTQRTQGNDSSPVSPSRSNVPSGVLPNPVSPKSPSGSAFRVRLNQNVASTSAAPVSPTSKKQPENFSDLVMQYRTEFEKLSNGKNSIDKKTDKNLISLANDVTFLYGFFELQKNPPENYIYAEKLTLGSFLELKKHPIIEAHTNKVIFKNIYKKLADKFWSYRGTRSIGGRKFIGGERNC
jgi:hypothetical protein